MSWSCVSLCRDGKKTGRRGISHWLKGRANLLDRHVVCPKCHLRDCPRESLYTYIQVGRDNRWGMNHNQPTDQDVILNNQPRSKQCKIGWQERHHHKYSVCCFKPKEVKYWVYDALKYLNLINCREDKIQFELRACMRQT